MKSSNFLNRWSIGLLFSLSFGSALAGLDSGTTQQTTTTIQVQDASIMQTSFPVLTPRLNGSSSTTDFNQGSNAAKNVHKDSIPSGTASNSHANTQLPTNGTVEGGSTPPEEGGGGSSSTSAQTIVDLLNIINGYDWSAEYDKTMLGDEASRQADYNNFESEYLDAKGYEDELRSDEALKAEVKGLVPGGFSSAKAKLDEFNEFLTKLAGAISTSTDGGTTDGGTTDGTTR